MFGIVAFVVRRGLLPLIIFGAGWYGGSKYGAPDLLIRAVDGVAARTSIALKPILNRGVEEGSEIVADVVEESSDYVVGTVEDMLEELATVPEAEDADATSGGEDAAVETASSENGQPAATDATPSNDNEAGAAAPVGVTDGAIVLCKTRISNPPSANAEGIVRPAGATVTKDGVTLMLMPATKSCLSSGYGPRGGKTHRGIDYYTQEDGDVLAAADGVIRERVTRNDYGNMIVIDHGNGVFTRYAHLERFGSGISEGASVSMGQVLGPIGNSGSSTVIHLHYEILSGEYVGAVGSFGLESHDPFALPAGDAHSAP